MEEGKRKGKQQEKEEMKNNCVPREEMRKEFGRGASNFHC